MTDPRRSLTESALITDALPLSIHLTYFWNGLIDSLQYKNVIQLLIQ